MVKEKDKKKKTRFEEKTLTQTLAEYARTALLSFICALIFTILLSFHARSEMIKNFYANATERHKINEQLARQLITQSDFMQDLRKKSYAVCIQVGNLYDSAGDYENAQLAYELALEKSKQSNYNLYYRISKVLIAQGKIDEAKKVITSVRDVSDKNLIKFKSRAYIEMGDKYYSKGKFLSAAKSYENAKYYYDKFARKDKVVEISIIDRIVNAYVETADVMVKSGLNSDAVRFLNKAEKYRPNNLKIKYKLAIVYSDLDPLKSVKYFETLMEKCPQDIDYNIYSKALMKAANISDWEGNHARAKYYRYKIHSVDMFVDRKVVYKDEIEIYPEDFQVKKFLFSYHLRGNYRLKNPSYVNIYNLYADFVLKNGDKVLETITVHAVDKNSPLYSNGGMSKDIKVKFGKSIFTKKELENYLIDIYLYKDEKYKTLIETMKIPVNSGFNNPIEELEQNLIEF